MTQKYLFPKSFVWLLLFALVLVVGCGGSSSNPPPPLTTEVIDLSHDGPNGFGFGDGPDATLETKRWQTFTATSNPVVTAVEVKVRKIGSGTYTPVLVELYNTTVDGKPTGARLAYSLIPPVWIGTDFTVVKTGLNYDGLVAGKQYAIVLTQGGLTNAHYEWCTKAVSPDLHFGKYTEDTGITDWFDESGYGDGWLKVYVASRITPPTRIYMYAAAVHNGNLKGSYPDARTGADFIAADRPLSLAGKTTHAFISISSVDSIANMPTQFGFPDNTPIVSATDATKIIADNWNDLLDGSIAMQLQNAFPMPDSNEWWSGSNSNGTYNSNNCGGWTDDTNARVGVVGWKDYTDNKWINVGYNDGDRSLYVLGIAY